METMGSNNKSKIIFSHSLLMPGLIIVPKFSDFSQFFPSTDCERFLYEIFPGLFLKQTQKFFILYQN